MYDIGANLCNEQFTSDLSEVLVRAKKTGVDGIILTTTDQHSWETNQYILNKHQQDNNLAYTLGVHPHHAKKGWFWVNDVRGEPCAIGETGLDYFRDLSERSIQRICFEYLIKQSTERGLPLFLHEREAHQDMISIIKNSANSEKKVIHCFTGDATQAENYLNLDCSFGIATWICDERRNKPLIEALKLIPLERIMLETDSPWLLPPGFQKKLATKRNEPSFLHLVAEKIANIKNVDVEEVKLVSQQNTVKFFKLPWLKNDACALPTPPTQKTRQ